MHFSLKCFTGDILGKARPPDTYNNNCVNASLKSLKCFTGFILGKARPRDTYNNKCSGASGGLKKIISNSWLHRLRDKEKETTGRSFNKI